MSSEAGSAHISIFPVLAGFRSKVDSEIKSSAQSADSIFKRILKKTGEQSGRDMGKSVKNALEQASKTFKVPALDKARESIAKLRVEATTAADRMREASAKAELAQLKYNKAVEDYGKDSVQAKSAEVALISAKDRAAEASDKLTAANAKLKAAQEQVNLTEKQYAPAKYADAEAKIKQLTRAKQEEQKVYDQASKVEQKAQDALSTAIRKYGSDSKQAQSAQDALTKAMKSSRPAAEKMHDITESLSKAQKQLNDAAKDYQPPKMSRFQQALEKARETMGRVGESGEKVRSKLSAGTIALGQTIANGISAAVGKVKDFAQESIEAYNEASEGIAKFNQIAANNGWSEEQKKSLDELSESLKNVGVIDDDVTRAGQAQLGTFKLSASAVKTLTPALDDMVAHTKGLNATQQDAVSIGNLMGKVMTGSVTALSRYGVTMDASQKKLLQHGNAEQRASTLAKILEENYGGVNKALAATPAGKIKQLQNNVDDLKKSLGKSFTSVVGEIAPVFTAGLQKAQKPIEDFAKWFTQAIKGISESLKSGNVSKSLEKAFGVNAGPILEGINGIRDGFKAAFSVITGQADNAGKSLDKTKSNVSPLATAFKTLGGVVKTAGNALKTIGPAVGPIAAVILTLVAAFKIYSTTVSAVTTANKLFNLSLSANPIGAVVTAVAAVIAILVTLEEKFHIFEKAGDAIKKAWNDVGKFFQNVGKTIGNAFQDAGKNISNRFDAAKKDVQKNWNDMGKWASKTGKSMAKGFKTFQTDSATLMVKAEKGARKAWDKTPDWFKNSVAGRIVKNFIDFPRNMQKVFKDPARAAQNIWNAVTSWFRSIPGRIGGFFSSIPGRIFGLFRSAGDKVKDAWNGVVGWFKSIPGKIVGFFKSIPSRMGEIGRNIIEGLKNGIQNSIGSVARVITGGMHSAIDRVKHALGIHSPSTVMRDEVGQYIGLGMAEGIKTSMPAVSSAMDDMAAIPGRTRLSAPRLTTGTIVGTQGAQSMPMTHADALTLIREIQSLHRDLGPAIRQNTMQITNRGFARLVNDVSTGRIR